MPAHPWLPRQHPLPVDDAGGNALREGKGCSLHGQLDCWSRAASRTKAQ